jgi:outer membrane protein TolC
MRRLSLPLPLVALGAVVVGGGCASAPLAEETAAREALHRTGRELPPARLSDAAPADLTGLRPDSPPSDFVRHAVLHHPAVRADYQAWRAAVEDINPARALPDPRLTFEADVTDTLMTFMPGVMFDFMTAGKRLAMGREAAAASLVARQTFIATVTRTAAEARKAWVELAYTVELDRLYRTTIHAVEEALALANADYTTARGMAGFDKQIRLQNLAAEHHAHHASVADRAAAARSRLKSALGLFPTDPDPPWPEPELTVTVLPAEDELWRRTAAANPELAKMRAMVDMAVAATAVARTARTPDFAVGGMVDFKASPLMLRPSASLSLPVWRDKIAALAAAAEARRDAAAARLSAEHLTLAAELAQMLYMVREADRMLAYLDREALPNLERGLAFAAAGVQSGAGAAGMIAETRLMAIDLRHQRVDLLRQRELAAIDLSLLSARSVPSGVLPSAELAAANP